MNTFPRASVRIKQLEEAVQIIRMSGLMEKQPLREDTLSLWCSLWFKPKPIPPIMIGGGGEKLTLKVVARYVDWWNIPNASLRVHLHKLGDLEEYRKETGRDPKEIMKT